MVSFDCAATTFALSTKAKQLPTVAVPGPSLAERFVELRNITTEYRADLRVALSNTSAPPTQAGATRNFWQCMIADGSHLAAGIVSYLNPSQLMTALFGGAAATKHKPAPRPPRGSLEDLLGRVHDVETYCPTTLAALSRMAEEPLRDTSQVLSEAARAALSKVVFHGELQDPIEIARSARWVALQTALETLAAVADGKDAGPATMRVAHAFRALEADEREALAPLVREAVFDGEKPRKPVAFAEAVSLYQRLVKACPVPPSVVIEDNVPEPEGAASLTRYGREVFALEEAIARAINPATRSFDGVVREVFKLHHSQPHQGRGDNVLGWDLSWLGSRVATQNNVIDPAVIGAAVGRALAGWHTPLERVGLKLVAQRALRLLDGLCVLGSEARAMLSAVVERGKCSEEPDTESTLLNERVKTLHAVLNSFNALEPAWGNDVMVQAATSSLAGLPAQEQRAIAQAAREQVFGSDLREATYFPGSVQLIRRLRAVIEVQT